MAVLNAAVYRLLREVRRTGSLSWCEAQRCIPDPNAMERAVAWLRDRELVLTDGTALRTPISRANY